MSTFVTAGRLFGTGIFNFSSSQFKSHLQKLNIAAWKPSSQPEMSGWNSPVPAISSVKDSVKDFNWHIGLSISLGLGLGFQGVKFQVSMTNRLVHSLVGISSSSRIQIDLHNQQKPSSSVLLSFPGKHRAIDQTWYSDTTCPPAHLAIPDVRYETPIPQSPT